MKSIALISYKSHMPEVHLQCRRGTLEIPEALHIANLFCLTKQGETKMKVPYIYIFKCLYLYLYIVQYIYILFKIWQERQAQRE